MKNLFYDKKGALDIGIGTIVILVIAMVIIGGMITFLNTFFGTSEESLSGVFDNVQDIGLDPTASQPLVFDGGMNVRTGRSSTVRAGVYNSDLSPADNAYVNFSGCSGNEENWPELTGLDQRIEPSSAAGFELTLTGSQPGEYICNVAAYKDDANDDPESFASRQVTVTVTS